MITCSLFALYSLITKDEVPREINFTGRWNQ